MNTLLFAYVQLGDAVYKHVGAMTDKDKSFLEERVGAGVASFSFLDSTICRGFVRIHF